jgi:hypothetical protein
LLLEKQMRVLLDRFSVGGNKSPPVFLNKYKNISTCARHSLVLSPLLPCGTYVVSTRVHVCPLSLFRVHHGTSLERLVLLSI